MDVYEFLTLATDLSGVKVSIYDMEHGEVVYDGEDTLDPIRDIEEQTDSEEGILYKDVQSYDIYKNRDGVMCLELNIEIEEEND